MSQTGDSGPPPMPDSEPPPSPWGRGTEVESPPTAGESRSGPQQFPCEECGALLNFEPGTDLLLCQYCGHENPIPESDEIIEELDFRAAIAGRAGADEIEQISVVHCNSCAAEFTLDANVQSDACPFCGSDVVLEPKRESHLKPKSLLPFRLSKDEARDSFRRWLSSRWFAPNKLKEFARPDSNLTGMYTPYWTYDSDTATRYTGSRGINYTTTVSDGKGGRRTVVRTRWTSVSGRVARFFDDVLVLASDSLPRDLTERLAPWDLENMVAYNESYLAGFRTESYQVDLERGFDDAKAKMERVIRSDIRRDIGGDKQRISSMNVRFDDITYKHILLPVWLAAYRYKDTTYRFVVNARTGEVHGERPWSWVKIGLAVLAAAVVAGAAYWVYLSYGGGGGGPPVKPV